MVITKIFGLCKYNIIASQNHLKKAKLIKVAKLKEIKIVKKDVSHSIKIDRRY